jgi:hypothetical protein
VAEHRQADPAKGAGIAGSARPVGMLYARCHVVLYARCRTWRRHCSGRMRS